MISVLILDDTKESLYPLIDKDRSVSFLPVSLNTTLLSTVYSWINGYFSKDKIFVVCSDPDINNVKNSCKGITESNIIIEPERVNFYISVFFASLVLNKMFPDESVLFLNVNFLIPNEFKMSNWLYASEEITEKDWIVIPAVQIGRDDRDTDYIDAGRILENKKGIEYFLINYVAHSRDKVKKKIFGKQGRFLNILFTQSKTILKSFLDHDGGLRFFKRFFQYFEAGNIDWDKIKQEYKSREAGVNSYNLITKRGRNFLTIFLDTKPNYLDNWESFIDRFSDNKERNVIAGNVQVKNCVNTVCFNMDNDKMVLEDLHRTVIFKKNGNVAIKSMIER